MGVHAWAGGRCSGVYGRLDKDKDEEESVLIAMRCPCWNEEQLHREDGPVTGCPFRLGFWCWSGERRCLPERRRGGSCGRVRGKAAKLRSQGRLLKLYEHAREIAFRLM